MIFFYNFNNSSNFLFKVGKQRTIKKYFVVFYFNYDEKLTDTSFTLVFLLNFKIIFNEMSLSNKKLNEEKVFSFTLCLKEIA